MDNENDSLAEVMEEMFTRPEGRQMQQNWPHKSYIQRCRKCSHLFLSYDRGCRNFSQRSCERTKEDIHPFEESPLICNIIDQGITATWEVLTDVRTTKGTEVKVYNEGLGVSPDLPIEVL